MRHGGKVSDQMRSAERVGGVAGGEVHRESIMDYDPLEAGQHPRLVGGGLASGLVREEIREAVVAGDVQPPRVATDLVAGLIDMQQRPVSQTCFELLDEAAQGTGGLRCKRCEKASGDTDAEHLCQSLFGPLNRQVLGTQLRTQLSRISAPSAPTRSRRLTPSSMASPSSPRRPRSSAGHSSSSASRTVWATRSHDVLLRRSEGPGHEGEGYPRRGNFGLETSNFRK